MTIGFLGAGKMAEAMIAALPQSGLCEPWEALACDCSPARRERMSSGYGVAVTDDARETARACRVLALAVKPQDLDSLLETIRPVMNKRHLLISVVAGRTLAALRRAVGPHPRLARVMPNLAVAARAGMSVYCAAREATAADRRVVSRLFGAAGETLELPERHFDAVTALSGSGPAFVAYMAQALIDAAVALKLPRATARLLAEQTLIGTGAMLRQDGRGAEALMRDVASPGGTTAAGLAVLERSDMREALAATLAAAAARSRELAR